jgi:glucose/mannose-6-phosphate isomerase
MTIGASASIQKHAHPIHQVYVSGLGGSGIGADFVSSFVKKECHIPYLVGKGYSIPAYVDQHTLFIASSYSGNTEETLSSVAIAEKTEAKIVVVSSGGNLIERAKEKGYDYIQVPGDWPSPRACLGYSVVSQLFVLQHLGLISAKAIKEIAHSIQLLDNETEEIQSKAKHIANYLFEKIPVIYIEGRMEPVAVRWRQQINENAKSLCWHHVIPEMNHNELVGWREKNTNLAVIYLRNSDDFSRNAIRMDINKEIISEYTNTIIEVRSKGESMIQKAIYLVHLGDWVSWHLCQLGGMDSMEVHVIDYLKAELAKVPE